MRNRILLLLLLLGGPALAGDKTKAREAYRSASQHYNLGEFAEALADFKEAYRNFEDPTILFNLAQCQRQLGSKQEAIYSYRAYLREMTDAPNRTEVQQLIAGLESALREEQSSKARPPAGVIQPTEPPAPEPVVVAPIPARPVDVTPPPKTPVYKKWWLWTAVAGVVVVGAGIGLGVGLTRSPSYPTAQTSDGTFHF